MLGSAPTRRLMLSLVVAGAPRTCSPSIAPGVNNAVGATPGVALISIDDRGLRGRLQAVARVNNMDAAITSCAPAGAPASNNRADVHGIAVRRIH